MRLQQALSQVQHTKQLSTSDNIVLNFFITAEGDYLRRAKAAIRKLYQSMHSGVEGFIKSYIIPNYELIKFIINTLPTVVKVLIVILPLVLQRKIANET